MLVINRRYKSAAFQRSGQRSKVVTLSREFSAAASAVTCSGLSKFSEQLHLTTWLDQYNTARPHTDLERCPPAARLRQCQLLCSTAGTVASSRPVLPTDRSSGPGQGSPKATGDSRRAASCVSDMSDSSGGASPLCNLMEVKH